LISLGQPPHFPKMTFVLWLRLFPAPANSSNEGFAEGTEVGQVRDLRARRGNFCKHQAYLLVGMCTAIGIFGWAACNGLNSRSKVFTTVNGPHQELILEALLKAKCEKPKVGSDCYRDVQYAQDHIKKHPTWYVGLRPEDGFKAFQHFLHHQKMAGGKRRCPKPCDYHPKSNDGGSNSLDGKCQDVEKGTKCYNHVAYTKRVNLPEHPDWYAGLSQTASILEIQSFLHEQDSDVCPKPCTKPESSQKSEPKPKKTKVHENCKKLIKPLQRLCEEKIKKKEKKTHKTEGKDEKKDCKDAKPGSKCFNDVLYAIKTLKEGKNLEWYPGLPINATRPMVQAYLHKQKDGDGSPRCPLPCNRKAVKKLEDSKLTACHTATEGTDKECYDAVCWVISTGIEKHPHWYPNISTADSFETVQTRLALDPKGKCAGKNPCPCETAKKGGKCWEAVEWVLSEGIKNHPDWYKGLTNESSFEQVQEHVHSERDTKCKLPCIFAPWWEKA